MDGNIIQHSTDLTQFFIISNKTNNSCGTIEGQSASGCVLAHLVLSHTLVPPCIILLEAGYLQHGIRVLHFDFTGEGNTVSPLPGDLWDGAGRDRGSKTSAEILIQVPLNY